MSILLSLHAFLGAILHSKVIFCQHSEKTHFTVYMSHASGIITDNNLALCRAAQTPSHSFGRYHAQPSECESIIALYGRCDIGVILFTL